MTLDEAFSKATKGPLECRKATGSTLIQPTFVTDTVATVKVSFHTIPPAESEMNARLLAHCFNHFQEVVKALEAVLDMDDDEWLGETPSTVKVDAEKVLAKVKEVKV